MFLKGNKVVVFSDSTEDSPSDQTPFGRDFWRQYGSETSSHSPVATATVQTACPKITSTKIDSRTVMPDTVVVYDDSRRVDPPGV